MDDRDTLTTQRIQNEWESIRTSTNSDGISFERDENNIRHLVATIVGPDSTPYEGGKFKIDIYLPDRYPIKPPRLRFITKIWHPNISSQNGEVRTSLLDDEYWSPATRLDNLMVSVQGLLSAPDFSQPLGELATSDYNNAPSSFDSKARSWTQMYATTANPPPHGTTTTSGTRLTKTPTHLKDHVL